MALPAHQRHIHGPLFALLLRPRRRCVPRQDLRVDTNTPAAAHQASRQDRHSVPGQRVSGLDPFSSFKAERKRRDHIPANQEPKPGQEQTPQGLAVTHRRHLFVSSQHSPGPESLRPAAGSVQQRQRLDIVKLLQLSCFPGQLSGEHDVDQLAQIAHLKSNKLSASSAHGPERRQVVHDNRPAAY